HVHVQGLAIGLVQLQDRARTEPQNLANSRSFATELDGQLDRDIHHEAQPVAASSARAERAIAPFQGRRGSMFEGVGSWGSRVSVTHTPALFNLRADLGPRPRAARGR